MKLPATGFSTLACRARAALVEGSSRSLREKAGWGRLRLRSIRQATASRGSWLLNSWPRVWEWTYSCRSRKSEGISDWRWRLVVSAKDDRHPGGTMVTSLPALLPNLKTLYEDLHAHPELSFAEHRTASLLADRLRKIGYEVTTGVGRTGVVAVLRNGAGPTVLMRADIDGLPVKEDTGLPYASTAKGIDPAGKEVPVAHACGHDMHATWLMGVAQMLAERRKAWSGTALLVLQPAEEVGAGALAMIEDRFFERFGTPDVALGQHVGPMPAGQLFMRAGPVMAAADGVRIVLYGRGAHASMPEQGVDPIVMAASVIMKLQT